MRRIFTNDLHYVTCLNIIFNIIVVYQNRLISFTFFDFDVYYKIKGYCKSLENLMLRVEKK